MMLDRLPRTRGKPRLSLSTSALYAWHKPERLMEPGRVHWRGRLDMRVTTRHGAKCSNRGWAAQAQSISERAERANQRLERHHLECDALWGRLRDHKRLLVIIDRKSRYRRLGMFKNSAVSTALGVRALLKGAHFETLTCDRGGNLRVCRSFLKTSYSSTTPTGPMSTARVRT
jgi:IS30 family transposase